MAREDRALSGDSLGTLPDFRSWLGPGACPILAPQLLRPPLLLPPHLLPHLEPRAPQWVCPSAGPRGSLSPHWGREEVLGRVILRSPVPVTGL